MAFLVLSRRAEELLDRDENRRYGTRTGPVGCAALEMALALWLALDHPGTLHACVARKRDMGAASVRRPLRTVDGTAPAIELPNLHWSQSRGYQHLSMAQRAERSRSRLENRDRLRKQSPVGAFGIGWSVRRGSAPVATTRKLGPAHTAAREAALDKLPHTDPSRLARIAVAPAHNANFSGKFRDAEGRMSRWERRPCSVRGAGAGNSAECVRMVRACAMPAWRRSPVP